MKRPLPPLLPFQPGFADLAISICLAILVLITRLPFRTGALYNWDSANFALALDHYDVTRHHPHPPGYFYYVIGARLLGLALGEANASLVAEGIIFSVLAVVSVYFLGKALFDRSCGLTAAILLMFSVTFWSYGTIALPYVSLAFFSAGAAFFAYRAASKRPHSLLALSTTYAIGGGFRPDLLLLLGPLWLFSHLRQPKREIGLSIGLVAVGFALWFVPTVWLSGGLDSYRAVLLAYLEVDVVQKYSSTSRGLGGLLLNVRDTASYIFYALYFTALPLLFGIGYIARHPGLLLSRLSTFVIIWIAPMFAFYILVHVGDPGYVFTILPALLVFGARAVAELKVSARLHLPKLHPGLQRALPPVLVIALVAGNVALSFQHPRPLTLNGIQAADDRFGRKIAYLRETFRASSDVLATYDSFRQLQYYLPWQKVVWIDIFDRREQTVALPQGTTKLILVDESLLPLAPESGEDIVLGGGRMRILVVPDGKHLRFVENKLKLE